MTRLDTRLETMPAGDAVNILGVDAGGLPVLTRNPHYTIPYKAVITAADIQDACDLLAMQQGGTVVLPQNMVYDLDGPVLVPNNVNIRGSGRAERFSPSDTGGVNIVCSTADAQIAFGDLTQSNTGGVSGGFSIDGNDIATQPFYVGRCAGRTFEDILVGQAAGDGIVLQEAQNCLFNRVDSEFNAGSGVVFDRGCGANIFMLPEIASNGEYNVKYVQTDVSPAVYSRPSENMIIGGNIERTVSGTLGTIYHGAGARNRIIGSVISASTVTAAFPMITMRKDGSEESSGFNLDNCTVQGIQAYTTAFDLAGSVELIISGLTTPYIHDKLFVMDDSARVRIAGSFAMSLVNTYFTNSGGVLTAASLIRTRRRAAVEHEAASASELVHTQFVTGDTQNRFTIAGNGAIAWGSGSSATDVSIFRGAPDGTVGLTVSTPIRISGRAEALHFTSGVPGAGLGQNGHIAIDVAGSAGAFIYRKAAGAWAAVL